MLKLDAMSYTEEDFKEEFKQLRPAEKGGTSASAPMRAQRWLDDWKPLKDFLEKEEARASEYVSALHFLHKTHAVREIVDSFVKRRYDAAVQEFEQKKG